SVPTPTISTAPSSDFDAACCETLVSSRRRRERVGHELGVEIFGKFAELAVGKAADVAIGVVVRLSRFGRDVAAAFDDNVIVFRNKALRAIGIAAGELREQWFHQIVEDGALASKAFRPGCGTGDRPAKVVGHRLGKRAAIALLEFGKNLL